MGQHDRRAFTIIELLMVVTIIAVIAAIAIPNIIAARKSANESAAIGNLKTISSAQAMFREGDKDGDGTPDYGTMLELSDALVIDSQLGAGRAQGYIYETDKGTASPENLWFALATPVLPLQTGERYFCTNNSGVIYYTGADAIPANYVDCTVPAGLLPLR